MGDYPAGRQTEFAGVLFEFAADQGEQAGLARTIGAGESDFVAGKYSEARPFK